MWLAWAAFLALPAMGFAQTATEPSVKAAFLYKLASYVEWPSDAPAPPEAPFTIGVMGADDVAAELEQLLRGRTIHNRPAVVRRLKEGEGGLAGLQVLYIGRREVPRLPALARAARPLSVLLVSDADRGLEAGSVINFVAVDDRVGFEVSIEAAERSNLKLSSRMLGVAKRVLAKSS